MEYINLLSPAFIYLYNKIQLYCKNVFEIKVPLLWQERLLSRKPVLIYCIMNELLKESRDNVASGRKTRVHTSQLQFCRQLCRFFFQLLKHTESVASCVAYNMLFYGGLQHGQRFISGAVYMPFFSRVLTEYETAN